MLHTKFHGNQPSGSGQEDFFTILIMWPNFLSPPPPSPLLAGCTWNLNEIGPVVA